MKDNIFLLEILYVYESFRKSMWYGDIHATPLPHPKL